ncbi:MAG TPA: peptidylprolyl isomerase [Minicystis sp.]|nr:peptidylprolyl isomerase [Minicystis sp.]
MRNLAPLVAFALPLVAGCGSLTSSPDWVGGGLAVEAPVRQAEEDRVAEVERLRIESQPKEVGAKHILIMHNESKSKPETVTRTKAQARQRAEEVLRKLRAGADFDEMVKEYTDEPGGAERHGDLGVFDRTAMVRAFTEAAFALQKGQISGIVETPFGYHIIKRTE